MKFTELYFKIKVIGAIIFGALIVIFLLYCGYMDLRDNYRAKRRKKKPRTKKRPITYRLLYRLSYWWQSLLFKIGIRWHNSFADECCADFTCCAPEIIEMRREIQRRKDELYKKGAKVFGDSKEFNTWLSRKLEKAGLTMGFLDTENGVKRISEELDRIANGYCL